MIARSARRPLMLLALLGLGVASSAQAQTDQPSALGQDKGPTLSEAFEGSTNTDGWVMDVNSTVGYNFSQHFGVDLGVPYYVVQASSSKAGTSSNNGLGNPYVDLRWIFKNPTLNYTSNLNGSAPTADTKKGLSTGRPTFDWDNHFDHGFGRLTPFGDAGIANSLSNTRYFKLPFTSLGNLAHFEAGSEVEIKGPLSFSVSAYDVAPWGTQKVFSKLVKKGSAGGSAKHGRVFEGAAETIGGASLTRDNGYNAGLDLSPSPWLDLGVGYSHSVHYALDTVSFGITFNLSSMVRRTRGQ